MLGVMTTLPTMDDDQVPRLRSAQEQALALFDAVIAVGILRPGVDERAASDAIRQLAAERFGVESFWHKRIVRAGVNTLAPYRENPPNLTLQDDDICFLDFGPVFADWEADLGRTYVLGSDPAKLAIRDAAERIWHEGHAHFVASPDLTAAQLYGFVRDRLCDAGYTLGDIRHVGHLVGAFPHERIEDDQVTAYLGPENELPIRRRRPDGQPWHWILEIHAVDRQQGVGAFFEQLLTC